MGRPAHNASFIAVGFARSHNRRADNRHRRRAFSQLAVARGIRLRVSMRLPQMLPEPRTEDDGRPYEVWINTPELGWFRSAIRDDKGAANDLADELRKQFKKVEVR